MDLKPQTWWNTHAEQKYDTFRSWVGDSEVESKKYMANYYIQQNATGNLIDLGCGDATFYTTLKSRGLPLKYIGVDSCDFFIKLATDKDINVINSDIRNITCLKDSSIEWVFSRHTLEHQSTFTTLLSEMIRLAKIEACHIFFIKPQSDQDIRYDPSSDLYHNIYSKPIIEKFLFENPKVNNWSWVDITHNECALHIQIKS